MNAQFTKAIAAAGIILIALAVMVGCGGQIRTADLGLDELYDRGMEKYEKEKYLPAIESFQALVFNYPGASRIDTAQYYLAMSYFGHNDFILAGVEFNRLMINYPASVFAPQAQLMKAVCFFEGTPKHYGLDQTDIELAIGQFEDFIIDYPESEAIDEARAYLNQAQTRLAKKYYCSGIVYDRVRDYRASRTYYQKVVDEYTNTEFAARSTFQMAEGYYQQKDWAEAVERFENFGIVFPEHEWAEKAGKRSCQALLKQAEQALASEEFEAARTALEKLKVICAGDSKKISKADEYLLQIDGQVTATAGSDDGGS